MPREFPDFTGGSGSQAGSGEAQVRPNTCIRCHCRNSLGGGQSLQVG